MLIPEFEQLEGIVSNILNTNISADCGDKFDIKRLCSQGKTQCNSIVNARICINNDACLS